MPSNPPQAVPLTARLVARTQVMRCFVLTTVILGTMAVRPAAAQGPTAEDLTRLIDRLVELDSIDLAPRVKFRAGLEPSLHTLDADESAMTMLKDPYAVQGQ